MKPAESRLPLDLTRVRDLLHAEGWAGPDPILLSAVPSTNAEAESLVKAGSPEGTCVIAEAQTAGRGREGRSWHSPAGAGVFLSFVVRPGDIPQDRWTWLSLVAGLAARDAIRAACRVPVDLKWPNDLMVISAMCGGSGGTRKLGGVLSEVIDGAVILGIGINVMLKSDELPTDKSTSIYLEGGTIDRAEIVAKLLPALTRRLAQWRADDPALRQDYRDGCLTIGRIVEIELTGGGHVNGIVSGIDEAGHLLVDDGETTQTITTGDVVHATI